MSPDLIVQILIGAVTAAVAGMAAHYGSRIAIARIETRLELLSHDIDHNIKPRLEIVAKRGHDNHSRVLVHDGKLQILGETLGVKFREGRNDG